jgi:hypothetical protein
MMSFLAIWRDKNPGQPDPDEATFNRFIAPIRTWWQEENPGQPLPDDAALYIWLCAQERAGFEEEWREENPGQPLPDDYEKLRQWAIQRSNERKLNFLRAMGETFH